MAGGIELIGRLKWGELVPDVVHLGRVAGLAGIAAEHGVLRIGAGATHAAIAGSPAVAAMLPDLAALWPLVANPRIRFAGTLGGNLMAGQAGYDGMPALLALGASLELATAAGARRIAAGDPLPAGALLTAALLPAGTLLFADRSLKPAIIAWLGLSVAEGRVTAARLGIGAAHDAAVGLTLPVAGTPLGVLGGAAEALGAWVAAALPEPVSDSLASAAYRRRMAGVLARRLLIRAGARQEP
jgi:CO/xanthine dehydrogenase FAD-binding subunit